MDVIITGLVGLISTIVSGWVSWFFARKKYNSEVDNNLIHNMQESLEFYKNFADDAKLRLDEVLERNKQLEIRNEKLEREVAELKNQVFNLMNSICMNFTCTYRNRDFNLFNEKITSKSKNNKKDFE